MAVENQRFNWRSSLARVVFMCTKYLLHSRISAMSLLPTAEWAGRETLQLQNG